MKCAEHPSFSNFDAVTALHSDDPEAAKRTVFRAMCRRDLWRWRGSNAQLWSQRVGFAGIMFFIFSKCKLNMQGFLLIPVCSWNRSQTCKDGSSEWTRISGNGQNFKTTNCEGDMATWHRDKTILWIWQFRCCLLSTTRWVLVAYSLSTR